MTINTILTDEEINTLVGNPFNYTKRVHRIFYEDEWDEVVADEVSIVELVKRAEQAVLSKVQAQQAGNANASVSQDAVNALEPAYMVIEKCTGAYGAKELFLEAVDMKEPLKHGDVLCVARSRVGGEK